MSLTHFQFSFKTLEVGIFKGIICITLHSLEPRNRLLPEQRPLLGVAHEIDQDANDCVNKVPIFRGQQLHNRQELAVSWDVLKAVVLSDLDIFVPLLKCFEKSKILSLRWLILHTLGLFNPPNYKSHYYFILKKNYLDFWKTKSPSGCPICGSDYRRPERFRPPPENQE